MPVTLTATQKEASACWYASALDTGCLAEIHGCDFLLCHHLFSEPAEQISRQTTITTQRLQQNCISGASFG